MSPIPAGQDAVAAPTRELLIELVGLHARAILRMPWIQASLMVGIALFCYEHVDHPLYLAWGLGTICVEALRARYASRILRRGYDIDPKVAHRAFVGLAALAGGALGLGGVLFLPQLPILQQALFGAVLFAIPAAGVAVSQSSRFILAAYAICALAPPTSTWMVLHPSQALGLWSLTILYWAVLILAATDGDKLLLRSVAIRHERDRLVNDLRQRNLEVQAAMAKAEEAARARARVLAAASHDLRQPLHALSVYSAVLSAGPPAEALEELAANIDQIVRALGNLLNGLLDLSRLSAGYYKPDHQPLSLDEPVRQVCAEFQEPASSKGLQLTQMLSAVSMSSDAVAIGRIARNLIDNAIKYTDQGEVRVETCREGDGADAAALLCVTDTGRGIPEHERGRIFEEFYQLDNPSRDRSQGVGLGLAIVQRLCELIGAAVTVDSQVGRGTRFEVRFPLPQTRVSVPTVPLSPQTEAALEGIRAYVVDDEPVILRSMRVLLSLWGMQVQTADSATAAEHLFRLHGPPDILIVDLRLDDSEHGAHLAGRLLMTYGECSVMIITGETSSEALRDANADGYPLLQKPIDSDLLRRSIARAIESRRGIRTIGAN